MNSKNDQSTTPAASAEVQGDPVDRIVEYLRQRGGDVGEYAMAAIDVLQSRNASLHARLEQAEAERHEQRESYIAELVELREIRRERDRLKVANTKLRQRCDRLAAALGKVLLLANEALLPAALAAAASAGQGEQQAGVWISVDERLPVAEYHHEDASEDVWTWDGKQVEQGYYLHESKQWGTLSRVAPEITYWHAMTAEEPEPPTTPPPAGGEHPTSAEQAAAPAGFISVTESLPEIGRQSISEEVPVWDGHSVRKGCYCGHHWSVDGLPEYESITHWRPVGKTPPPVAQPMPLHIRATYQPGGPLPTTSAEQAAEAGEIENTDLQT